jgi:hypothetical protein
LDPHNIDIVQAHRDFANHLIGQLCPAPA